METGDEDVGTVADEAAKLLGALRDWASESGAAHSGAAATAASSLASGLKDFNEHISTGAEECRYCPLCRGIDAVRQVSPEVRAHLIVAASSLLQAASGLLETHVPAREPHESGVQRIDLDGPSTQR